MKKTKQFEIETFKSKNKTERSINSRGEVSGMAVSKPLAEITFAGISKTPDFAGIKINGRWFVAADAMTSLHLEEEFKK